MRIFRFIIGITLLIGIVFLGDYTTQRASFVIWFGVITALVAPIAFQLIFTSFKSKDDYLLGKLSKVPEIENLINAAKDNESKIKLLEQQREELETLIVFESKRRTLIAERDIYLIQGKMVLKNFHEINHKLEILTRESQTLPVSMQALQEEIQKFDSDDLTISLFKKSYVLPKSFFALIPFYGPLMYLTFKEFMPPIVSKIKK